MAPFKLLERHELEKVHNWLTLMGMPVSRMMHRDYADGVLVAKLIKKLCPRMVDLHNYQAHYSRNLKTINWQTLNLKVLHRIGLPLAKEQIELLVKGESGTIERLIWEIMKHTDCEKNFNFTAKKKPVKIEKKQENKMADKATMVSPKLMVTSKLSTKLKEKPKMKSVHSSKRKTSPALPIAATMSSQPAKVTSVLQLNSVSSCYLDFEDERITQKSHEAFEFALNEVRAKIITLEDLLSVREKDIRTLTERVHSYEVENLEFRKVVGPIKHKG